MANKNMGFVDIDGAKLKDAIKAKEYKMTDLSLKIGKGSTFLTESCKRNTIDPTAYKFICSICGFNEDDFKPNAVSEKEPSDVSPILAQLTAMDAKLDSLNNQVGLKFEDLSNLEKAILILKGMQFHAQGAVDTTDYEAKLKQYGVPYELIKPAMENTGSQFITKNYGKNAVKWIVKL